MREYETPKDIDPSVAVVLRPGFHGEGCPGNGEHGDLECCCEECDYYMECFPDWMAQMDLTKAVEFAK